MKTATLPSLRVTPALRDAAITVLQDGETLSAFLETSLKENIQKRQMQKEFIARGLAAKAEAERTGIYHSLESVMQELKAMRLAVAKPKGKVVKAA